MSVGEGLGCFMEEKLLLLPLCVRGEGVDRGPSGLTRVG